MRTVALAAFLVILILLHEKGDATRYLPSIVWDHYNPMLSCKCNWFNTNNRNDSLVKVEIYDRFEFVCPTELLNVRLLDSHSRPRTQMNLNLFMRKWKNGSSDLDGLKAAMKSGEFCDPEHDDTEKLLTCKDGEKGKGVTVRFAKDTGYVKDDLAVFFNNGDDGTVSTLTSKKKKCAMALIVLVTWQEPMNHDLTYGKDLKRQCQCNNMDQKCDAPCMSTTTITPTSIKPTPTSIKPTPASTNPTPTTSTNKLSPTITKTTNNTSKNPGVQTTFGKGETNDTNSNETKREAQFSGRTKDDWDKFKYGFAVGFLSMFLISIVGAFAYCVLCRKKGQASSPCNYKVGDQCQTTTVNDLEKEKQAKPSSKKMSLLEEGANNKGYQSHTLKRGDGITI